MTTVTDVLITADLFWTEFVKNETYLKELLFRRTYEDHTKARHIIDNIINNLNITNSLGVLFGVDVRNALVLPERKDYIELILTPLYQRKNKNLLIALYNSHNKYLSNNWSVVKYKYWQPSNIDSITVNYPDSIKSDTLIEITKDDLKYYPIIEHSQNKLSILLFINDTKAPYLIKKEKYEIDGNVRELWIPKDYGIYAILDSAIGEYNLLNTLNKMEIYLESEEPDVERRNIENLIETVNMITNNPMTDINKCARCNYSNTQVNLKRCKCKNVYYCDSICQKAHRDLHKSNCI